MDENQEIKRPPLVINEHRESLGKTFEKYLKTEVKSQNPRILSVGCGCGFEAEPALRIFPNAKYKGIDINEESLGLARDINEDISQAVFEIADATKKGSFGDKPWDLVILRNPQVPKEIDQEWSEIIKNSIEVLKKDGIIFVTTSSEREKVIISQYLGRFDKNLKIIVNEENQHKTKFGSFRDDFIIIAKKL